METRSSLIRRVHDPGDAESWREFVRLYEPLLLGYARSQGLGEADARDLVQDVFAGLLRTMQDFELDRHRGRFRSWLWQVVRNAMISRARSRKGQTRAEAEWGRRLVARHLNPDREGEAEWTRRYRRRVLEFALETVRAQVRPATWACFERHALRGRPGEEVAAELGTTVNAVFINTSRVLERIRTACATYEEDLGDDVDDLPRRA